MSCVCYSDKVTQKKLATDPMFKLEHSSNDQQGGKATHLSVAQIEDLRNSWSDDYMLNKMARTKFRVCFVFTLFKRKRMLFWHLISLFCPIINAAILLHYSITVFIIVIIIM